ncbi:non-structural maintenance of chromosomes element 1 homolog [Spea bombifrons]|uniref:non-structural maintenance of chromosomes element 1 homolog n=1 Tax=Spea bombifrons TaxID=233779 RepID=UPI00234A8145|nr:non-structural maintenance of chromosomes element 1 homolog [Spea bombifrons]XP_053327082.1 non-structural maintenance of chromosomes element 1 homolog [Spea bombifrons]
MAQITESHQRFLQVLMSHGIMEGSAVRNLHKHCCEAHKVHYMQDRLDDFIDVINKHLQPLFMQIRKRISEDDGKRYYALVNLAENEITKMASDYAENELELFRKTMDLIVTSENGFASSTRLLNLSDELQTRKIKKKEVEQLLQKFVQEKWLIEREGEYTLHTRCIMELEPYIRNTFQDVKICNICRDVAIQSQMCETCGIQIHIPCAGKYFKGQAEPHCPNCNELWAHEIPRLSQSSSQKPSTSQSANIPALERRTTKTSVASRTRQKH